MNLVTEYKKEKHDVWIKIGRDKAYVYAYGGSKIGALFGLILTVGLVIWALVKINI